MSIESDAQDFIEAINAQSLFRFTHDAPITSHSNNIYLIAAKHLLRKFGGEYFYFEKEVRIELPVTTLSAEEPQVWADSVTPIQTSISALIFDSDPIDKMVLLGYLEKLGVATEKASAKQVVLQKIRHDTFDIIIVNSEFLNDSDPFFFTNFASELSNQPKQTHILVVSSKPEIQNTKLFKTLKAHYLPKPIDVNKLKATLIKLCAAPDSE